MEPAAGRGITSTRGTALARRERTGRGPGEGSPEAWLPTPGTVVEVGIPDSEHAWTTRIEHRDGTVLVLVAPTVTQGETVAAEPGTELLVSWPTELGKFEAVCQLTGSEVDVVLTWQVEAVRLKRQQRRAAYRLPVAVPVKVDDGTKVLGGATSNVSELGVGFRVAAREAPQIGDEVEVTVQLPGHVTLTVPAEVVRIRDVPGPDVEVGLRFLTDDPEMVDELRRFVFVEQLARRQGGAG